MSCAIGEEGVDDGNGPWSRGRAQRNSKMSAVLWEAIYDGDLAQANKGRIKMILQVRQSWRWF